jgi:hypothetical protein
MSRTALLDNVFANLASAQHSLTNALAAYVGSPEPTPAPAKEAKLPKAPKEPKASKLATRRAALRAQYGPLWFQHPDVVAAKAERKAKWEAIKAKKATPAPEPKAPKAKKPSKNRAAAVAAVAKAAK